MFDAKQETENIIQFIRNYYQENQLGGVVIGISGGKDSAVVAGLFCKALGSKNVIGVTLPCHSKEKDREDAKLISNYYHFELINFDLGNIFDNYKEEIRKIGDFSENQTQDSDINLKPRLRMATLYYLASLYSKKYHQTYLVAGTSNQCELYVGYFTKGGDSVHDIAVLADYTVEEVIKIGEYLQVPKEVLYKIPDDGLSNQSDEEKLDVTYQEIAQYIKEPKKVKIEQAQKIEKMHQANQHKFYIPTYRRNK